MPTQIVRSSQKIIKSSWYRVSSSVKKKKTLLHSKSLSRSCKIQKNLAKFLMVLIRAAIELVKKLCWRTNQDDSMNPCPLMRSTSRDSTWETLQQTEKSNFYSACFVQTFARKKPLVCATTFAATLRSCHIHAQSVREALTGRVTVNDI